MSPPWLQPMHADPVPVDPWVVLDRPVAGGERVVDLAAAVIDGLVKGLPVAGGAAVLGSDHDIALGHELAHDVGVVGREVGVDPAVGQNQEREFAGAVKILRGEEIGVELDRVAGADAVGVFLAPLGRAVDPHLLDHRHVADPLGPEHVVDELGKDIALVRGRLEPVFEGLDLIVIVVREREHDSSRQNRGRQEKDEFLHLLPPGRILLFFLGGQAVAPGKRLDAEKKAMRRARETAPSSDPHRSMVGARG